MKKESKTLTDFAQAISKKSKILRASIVPNK